jgi:hypothetical protein
MRTARNLDDHFVEGQRGGHGGHIPEDVRKQLTFHCVSKLDGCSPSRWPAVDSGR